MYTIYIIGVSILCIAGLCELIGLHEKDLRISRLETENRRLKETAILEKVKANRYRLMIENK